MKALTWQGKRDVRVEEVPDPRIEEPTDAVVRITSTAICGSACTCTRCSARSPAGRLQRVGPGHSGLRRQLMRLTGFFDRPVEPHEGVVFTPDPAGESVRGGWLPDLSQVARSVGGVASAVGSAVLPRRG